MLHAVQELRSVIDDRLRGDLGGRNDRHSAQSAGTDKLSITFIVRAATHADAIRSAGLAAGTLAELLTDNRAAVDLSGVVLAVRAQQLTAARAASRCLGVPALGPRIEHLESAHEGLQDAVYRRAVLEDESIGELRRRAGPGQIARDLSAHARRRGL